MIYNEFEKIPFRFLRQSHPKLQQIYAVLYYLEQGYEFDESILKASNYFPQINDKFQTVESKLRRNFAGTKATFYEWYKTEKISIKLKELLELPEQDLKIFSDLLNKKDEHNLVLKEPEILSEQIEANDIFYEETVKTNLSENDSVRKKYGSRGEGIEHKQLKEWIANNPKSIGLNNVRATTVEHSYLSGDSVDILFELTTNKDVVVEIETINPLPGCHQAIKYRVLRCAERGLPLSSDEVQAMIVAWDIPTHVVEFCEKYNIKHFEKKI